MNHPALKGRCYRCRRSSGSLVVLLDEAAEAVEEIYEAWHERARAGAIDELIELYAPEAIFESPLVPVLTDCELDVCRGHEELRRFLEEGVRARPNELVRWYRTGEFLSNGRLLSAEGGGIPASAVGGAEPQPGTWLRCQWKGEGRP
jgi:hypothetical protein